MTDEQEVALAAMVEASRGLPGSKREPFTALSSPLDGSFTVLHPGLPGRELAVYPADLVELELAGMLLIHNRSKGHWYFDLSSAAFTTYSALNSRRGQPLDRIEQPVRRYLAGDRFRTRHAEAHGKWEQAEALLWGSDSGGHYTTIGHLCREAMQLFGSSLLHHYPTADAPTDSEATKNRIEAVIRRHTALGKRRQQFLEDVLALWKSVVDLGQRQEHGAAKESDPLTWEDGRRLVQYTAITMHEIDGLLP
jgi:hypothetical protein